VSKGAASSTATTTAGKALSDDLLQKIEEGAGRLRHGTPA
jgi:hypothetical protein